MHASLIALGFKLGDMPMWQRFFHSKVGLTLASLVLGIIGTLGFAPYQFWVITLVTLGFEFFLVQSLKTKKQVFWSLWVYFTALNAATLSWLNFVMHGFGQMPLPLSWFVEILLSAYLAIFHGLLGSLAFKFAHRFLPANKPNKATKSVTVNATQASADKDNTATTNADDKANAETEDTKANADDDYEDDTEILGECDDDEGIALEEREQEQLQDAHEQNGEWHFYSNAFLLCFLPVALIAADYIAGWLFTGFPWMYIGYTALEGPFSAYAPLLGVRGITLVMFVCAGALALTLNRKYVYLPVAGVLFAIGIFCQGISFTNPLPAIKVTGIQGNIAQQVKWDPRQIMPTISHYVEQTLPYFNHSDLIIWPESALPVFAQEIEPILKDLNTMAYSSKTPLVTGIQHLEFPSDTGSGPVKSFNSIYLLGTSDDLEGVQIYNKRQLVPFGEQVPFESVTRKLGSIFNFPMSGFSAGAPEQSQLTLTLTQTHANPESNLIPKGKLSTQKRPQLAGNVDALPNDQANTSTADNTLTAANASIADTTATSADSTSSSNPASASSAVQATNAIAATSAAPALWPEADVGVTSKQDQLENASQTLTSAQNADNDNNSNAAGDDVSDDNQAPAQLATAPTHEPSQAAKGASSQELAAGEEDWFNEAPPAFPQDVARPLAEPMQLKFIPAICYESIFPELMTSLHDESTNGIVMISNDSWFGDTRGPDEHLAIARMRALEMQKPMIRITNSGHTVLIDDRGMVTAALPQDKLAILHTDFVPNVGMTPYVRYHNLPFWAILLVLLGIGYYLRKQKIDLIQQNLEALVRP